MKKREKASYNCSKRRSLTVCGVQTNGDGALVGSQDISHPKDQLDKGRKGTRSDIQLRGAWVGRWARATGSFAQPPLNPDLFAQTSTSRFLALPQLPAPSDGKAPLLILPPRHPSQRRDGTKAEISAPRPSSLPIHSDYIPDYQATHNSITVEQVPVRFELRRGKDCAVVQQRDETRTPVDISPLDDLR